MRLPLAFTCLLTCLTLFSSCARQPNMQSSGGVILTYSVTDFDPKIDDLAASGMARSIQSRLDPERRHSIIVKILNNSKVEISVPNGGLPVARAKRLLQLTGHLEFLIAANSRDHAELIEAARASKDRSVKKGEQTIGRWVAAARDQASVEAFSADGLNSVIRNGKTGEPVELSSSQAAEVQAKPSELLGILKTLGVDELEMLMVVGPIGSNLTAEQLTSVQLAADGSGQPAIAFEMNDKGEQMLQTPTSSNLPRADGSSRSMGVILDNQVMSLPHIRSAISGRGLISGNFSKDEAELIVEVLRVGRLPFKLKSAPDTEIRVKAEQ